MKAVVTRVTEASVTIENEVMGKIGQGFLVLLGIGPEDTEETAVYLADRVCGVRVFEDENGKMNLSILDTNGSVLSISQFTLYADCKKGNRPSFINAMNPENASKLYDIFNQRLGEILHVETGIFGADMKVEIYNDGPVTIILDSNELINK